VQPLTQNMLTPESLSELMGGPDIVVPAPGIPGAGPPDSYDERNPLPPPWYPQPGPVPGAAPGVLAGDPLGAIAPAEAGAGQ
jgi:phospholipid/cholesterol/gamma-HCH transport system substrate-binding protein